LRLVFEPTDWLKSSRGAKLLRPTPICETLLMQGGANQY
jgi:hypothetical protein